MVIFCGQYLRNFFKKKNLEDISPFCRATDIPVLEY